MKRNRPLDHRPRLRGGGAALLAAGLPALLLALAGPAAAKDTDMYQEAGRKQNAYILLDASASMHYPVYEDSIDYGKLYDWYWSRTGAQLAELTAAAKAADTANKTFAANYSSSCSGGGCSVGDVSGAGGFYQQHFEKDKIYLIWHPNYYSTYLARKSGAAANSANPDDYFDMPTDFGIPDNWYNDANGNIPWVRSYGKPVTNSSYVVDTHTLLQNGRLTDDGTGQSRVSTDDEGWVTLDGIRMPYSLNIKLNDPQQIKATQNSGVVERGAAVMDSGFESILGAPGYHASGFTSVAKNNVTRVGTPTTTGSSVQTYIFVKGNFLNFLQHLGLVLKNGATELSMAGYRIKSQYRAYWWTSWSAVQKANWLASVVPYPMSADEWPDLGYALRYPDTGLDYAPGETGDANARAVEAPGAKRVQLRFASLDLGAGDHLRLYAGEGEDAPLLKEYTSANNSATGFWTEAFATDVVVLKLVSDDDANVGKGYRIDRFRSIDRVDGNGGGLHVLQARQEVAREALNVILDKFTDIHWGYYEYASQKGVRRGRSTNHQNTNSSNYPKNPNWEGNYAPGGAGADFNGNTNAPSYAISPGGFANFVDIYVRNDNAEQTALVKKALEQFNPSGQTPTQQSLQELWLYGFHKLRDRLGQESCFDNMIIHLTDGFPTNDHSGKKFREAGLSFPETPAGAKSSCPNGEFCDWDGDNMVGSSGAFKEYYDDVAQWMYEHSWEDGSATSDSEKRVTVHNIAFGARMDILKNASEQTPGSKYLMAGNKAQLIAAFNAIADTAGSGMSFSAPTISADASSLDSGRDAYSGLFLPRSDAPWAGNIKWYKRGDSAGNDAYSFYGKGWAKATDDSGLFREGVNDWWGTGEAGAAYNATKSEVVKGGVGQLLLDAVNRHLNAGKSSGKLADYYRRPIFTCELDDDDDDDCDELVELGRAFRDDQEWDEPFDMELVSKHLGVNSTEEAEKIINYTYGYTYEAGTPTEVRDWILGAIVHSKPLTIDYYANDDVDEPYHRLIAVGANDGMLHVFDDDGQEIFAFVPPDVLHLLKDMPTNGVYVDSVDGELTLYRQGDPPRQPKYLMFGLRNGGASYWCLDISMESGKLWKDKPWLPLEDDDDDELESRWEVEWSFRHPEIHRSWSKVQTARIPVGLQNGKRLYKDVAIFAGGYDPMEENFPEPFDDNAGTEAQQKTGTPFDDSGALIASKWTANGDYDMNKNGDYDIWNQNGDSSGRSFFVVDIEAPDEVTMATYEKKGEWDPEKRDFKYTPESEVVLPFKVTWGETSGKAIEKDSENKEKGLLWTRSDMKWCFPATPSAAMYTDNFKDGDEVQTRTNVLAMLYAPDIYGNLFKARYNIGFENIGTESEPDWRLRGEGWEVRKIFSANPGTGPESGKSSGDTSTRAGMEGSSVAGDQGRKVFYAPTISFGGTSGLFEAANFADHMLGDSASSFKGRDGIASVFFGTGDREHPNYTMVHNRIYGIYDDSSLYAVTDGGGIHDISSINLNAKEKTYTPYTAYDERDLLNMTCDELGTEIADAGHIATGGDFDSWLKATYGEDAVLTDVISELAGSAELGDWLEEQRPWLFACSKDDSAEKCQEKKAALNAAVTSASAVKDYLAKKYLTDYLIDDALDGYNEDESNLERGGERNAAGKRGTENDRKGWYIKLDRQATSDCAHMQNAGSVDTEGRDNHRGEAMLAPLTLYYGVLYGTSFQPVPGDTCSTSGGNAFPYALDYATGKAAYNYNAAAGGRDFTDRYVKYEGVSGLPSEVSFIFEGDQVVPVVQIGSQIVGFAEKTPFGEECAGEDCKPGVGGITSPSPGLELYYWRDSNSQEDGAQNNQGANQPNPQP